MTEREFETSLLEVMEVLGDDGQDLPVTDAESFEDHGVLTRNRGVVVRLADGSEFHLTIVRSACGDVAGFEDDLY